jgi:DNA-binding XRE family transcriptional regulator
MSLLLGGNLSDILILHHPMKTSTENQDRQFLKILGIHLRRWRENLGYTQEQFAPIADFTRSYITEIETGKRNISFLNFIKLIQVLKVDSSELLNLFKDIQNSKEK